MTIHDYVKECNCKHAKAYVSKSCTMSIICRLKESTTDPGHCAKCKYREEKAKNGITDN